MAPVVSFIIAAYNAGAFIEEAIEAARAQTTDDIEIIVVDDCSQDCTAEIVSRIARSDERVRCVSRVSNEGASAARNDGIKVAQGEWVAVLDADDRITPDRTERLLEIAGTTSADIVADNLIIAHTRSGKDALAFPRGDDPYYFSVDALEYVRRNTMLTRGFKLGYLKPMFRRSMLEERNILYDETIRIGEDYLLCLKALMDGLRFVVTSEPLYEYRVNAGSLSSSLNRNDILSLVAAQQDLAVQSGSEAFRRELMRSNEHLETVLTFTSFIEQVKRHQLAEAASVALFAPRIWGHILRCGSEAVAKRLHYRFAEA